MCYKEDQGDGLWNEANQRGWLFGYDM